MTPDAVVRAWFHEVWNEGREETIHRLMAKDAVGRGLPGGPLVGHDGFKQLWRTFKTAFSEMHVDVEQTVTQGDRVVAYNHVVGRHTGEGFGPPSGRRMDIHGFTLARVQNDQIVEAWDCYDFLNMYAQIGLVNVPGT